MNMSSSSSMLADSVGIFAYYFARMQPMLPTYGHLIISAVLPIYAGAHASLSKPVSAAKPEKPKDQDSKDEESADQTEAEETAPIEGFSPSDALLYPLLTGSVLAGLYFLLKWLEDPTILNTIINWYLSIFGTFSVGQSFVDAADVLCSFIFPSRYIYGGKAWVADGRRRKVQLVNDNALPLLSPLPSALGRVPLPPFMIATLWLLRDSTKRAILVIDVYVKDTVSGKLHMTAHRLFFSVLALVAVAYFNLFDRPWWLTNLLGFSFCYAALQLMSPTTFWTGTLVLTALFFYDIYFVFFTPIMIAVATKLDIPVKLVFPRPAGADEDPSKQHLAMLGLGDIVIPGMMIAFALRFDLYLFYLRKQTLKYIVVTEEEKQTKSAVLLTSVDNDGQEWKADYVPVPYQRATGSWGERFWLGKSAEAEGGSFPKPYFCVGIASYIFGLLCTLVVMQIYQHGQPALLYLVPSVLFSLWGAAWFRGEIDLMWKFTENVEEAAKTQIRTRSVIPKDARALEMEGKERIAFNKHKEELALHGDVAAKYSQEQETSNDNDEQTRPRNQVGDVRHTDKPKQGSSDAKNKEEDRRWFSLIVSLPSPYPLEGSTERSQPSKEETLAEGEPPEKRQRLS